MFTTGPDLSLAVTRSQPVAANSKPHKIDVVLTTRALTGFSSFAGSCGPILSGWGIKIHMHASARTSIGVVRIASALQLGELRIDQRRKRVSAAGRDRDSDMFGKVMERAPGLI